MKNAAAVLLTLPITGLAEASQRPANFVGLHFFSPVDRMLLVEVIRGRETSETTIARAMDFVKRIRKTPIVVNDGRAFYTSRVFGTYVYEGMALLNDGVHPALIERAGTNAGMPVGPLALMDEVSLELMHKVMRQTKADLGAAYKFQPQDPVLIKMVEELKRLGRKSGGGFYDSVAVKSGLIAKRYLSLDQAMVMGAIGNVFAEDVIRRNFSVGDVATRIRPLIGMEQFSVGLD